MVQEENNLQLWSTVLGWTYFLAWSISFYQQPWLNFKRASVRGLSAEFLFYNVTGFLFCESIPVRFRPRHSPGLFAAQTQPTRLPSTCCRKTLGCRCQVQFGSPAFGVLKLPPFLLLCSATQRYRVRRAR